MRRALIALALFCAALGSAEDAQADEVVRVKVPPSLRAVANKQTIADVQVTVQSGFHVQANPVRNPLLIPIVLNVPASGTITPGAPIYPASKIMRLKGSAEDLVVYDRTFVIRLPLNIAGDAPAGRAALRGTLRYQACDDRHCLFPTTLPIELAVIVAQ